MTAQRDRIVFHLTGGIGSGKSAVSGLLERLGATVVDGDRIGHWAISPEGPSFYRVAERWPSVVVDGEIDRRALGNIVFEDPDQLRELEAFTHAEIAAEIGRRVEAATGVIFLETANPVAWLPSEWRRVVVTASRSVRLKRVVARGLSKGEAKARIAAQPSDEAWLELADSTISNAGSWDDLGEAVDAWWKENLK